MTCLSVTLRPRVSQGNGGPPVTSLAHQGIPASALWTFGGVLLCWGAVLCLEEDLAVFLAPTRV